MKEISIELVPLFEKILKGIDIWNKDDIISKVLNIGEVVIKHINGKYMEDDKFRVDRNEMISYFDSIKKFNLLDLPISIDHFKQLTNTAKNRILPYPHYSGIKISISNNLFE